MSPFHAALLGLIEGLTEFLPVSSTGHLILAAEVLRVPQTAFVKSFEIVIQLGAILAIVLLQGRRLIRERAVLARTVWAFLPTAVIGFLLYQLIKTHLIGNAAVVVAALFTGGVILILFERWHKGRTAVIVDVATLPYRSAFLIGLAQALAVVPGVSRSAATIVAGLALGMRRSVIVEFSFLLAIPTMAAATGYDLLKTGVAFTAGEWGALGIGFGVAFLSAYVAARWFLAYVRAHDFTPFGWYRIGIALAFALFVLR